MESRYKGDEGRDLVIWIMWLFVCVLDLYFF
jgi:hypothetical protein